MKAVCLVAGGGGDGRDNSGGSGGSAPSAANGHASNQTGQQQQQQQQQPQKDRQPNPTTTKKSPAQKGKPNTLSLTYPSHPPLLPSYSIHYILVPSFSHTSLNPCLPSFSTLHTSTCPLLLPPPFSMPLHYHCCINVQCVDVSGCGKC